MKQIDFNFLTMSDRVMAHMRRGMNLWKNEPEIVEVIGVIEEKRSGISTKGAAESGLSGKGFTTAKDSALDSLVTKTCKLSKKISGYAKKRGLLELIPLVDVSVNFLASGPEKKVINRCKGISELAVKHFENLGSFKVTTDEIKEIDNLIAGYQNHIDNRSNTNISKSSFGVDILNNISEIRHQYDILDDLIEGFLEDGTFIREYKEARLIDDFGKGKTLKNKPDTED